MQMLHFFLHHKIVQNEDLARRGPTGRLGMVELGCGSTCNGTFCLIEHETTVQSLGGLMLGWRMQDVASCGQ